jgi:hypothetical protein
MILVHKPRRWRSKKPSKLIENFNYRFVKISRVGQKTKGGFFKVVGQP